MSYHYKNDKLTIIIFIILLIAFIIPNLICYRIEQQRIEEEKMREGFLGIDIEDITGPITSGIVKPVGGLLSKPIKDFENLVDDVFSVVEDVFDGVKSIIEFIGSIPIKITDWGNGVSNHVKCGSAEFEYGWTNTFKVIDILMPCFWEKFQNLANGNCTRYYITDLILGLTYGIFVQLPIILLNAVFGINLQPILDFFYELIIVPIDAFIYAISGYHLVKWSDDIINECYRCKGTYKFASGRSIDIYKPLDEWAKLLNCSTEQIRNGIMKIFTSFVPGAKWQAWVNGEHLPGWDNEPDFWGK